MCRAKRTTALGRIWTITMKKMLLVAAAMLSLGMGTAFAVNGGTTTKDPQYGTYAFPNQEYKTGTVFSEIYDGLFGHRDRGQTDLTRTSENDTKTNTAH